MLLIVITLWWREVNIFMKDSEASLKARSASLDDITSNMASNRVSDRSVQEELRTAEWGSSLRGHSVLIIVGRTGRHRQTEHISRDIERGIRSWDVDLKSCNLNLHLQEFLSHHTASFKSAGQKCLRHSTRVLDTHVLISPSQELAHSEVSALLSRATSHKLLILTGMSVEDSGAILFHRGHFSADHLRRIITEQSLDQEISGSCFPPNKINLTVGCPNGHWRKLLLGNPPLHGLLTIGINPPEVLPDMESLRDFTSLISGTIYPASPFDLLPPPTTVGFLKLSRPCCYVFPAGSGDCAFFAVNGFTVLLDGGSDSHACFWMLVRHLDRVDAVLLTHIGTENLPGAISFLERKVAEKEIISDVKDDSKKLISPELGVVFFNAPNRLQVEQHSYEDNILKSTQQAVLTLQLLKKLDIQPHPMFRPPGAQVKPLTLFQKMGVGQLDLYILSPAKNSQEYETIMHNWPNRDLSSSESHGLPLTALTSVSALLVWLPACPQEKVVRVLFPGATPQAKLLQGMEKLKGLDFLQKPTVTSGDLERQGMDQKANRRESMDSAPSQGKEGTVKIGKDRTVKEEGKEPLLKEKGRILSGVGGRDSDKGKIIDTAIKRKPSEKTVIKKGGRKDERKDETIGCTEVNNVKRNEQVKQETKNENKTKAKREARDYSKTGEKKTPKPFESEANNRKKVQKKNYLKKDPDASFVEEKNQRLDAESVASLHESKVSTPEDITADLIQLHEERHLEEAKMKLPKENQKIHDFVKKTGNVSPTEQTSKDSSERSVEREASKSDELQVQSCDSGEQSVSGTIQSTGEDLFGDPGKSTRPAKVVGLPLPLKSTPSRNEHPVQVDVTPTEYTLLDGALRNFSPPQSSPENQAANSFEEETAEPASSNSRPNSAGHTPYCLSPDDVWCNRATLSRLRALESADPCELNGSNRQCEEQVSHAKGAHENSSTPKEKHLHFLPLGTFKEGSSDPSPSVATTTTHSLPAEVSSPQSTEVDESLSMSFEQGPSIVSQREGDDSVCHSQANGGYFVGKSQSLKKVSRSSGQSSEGGRPLAPGILHLEGSPHDVDLCLVSPCEFKHFKPQDAISGVCDASGGPFIQNLQGNNNNNPKDQLSSESTVPVCTEDCPSTTADGALDSDSDESCSDPSKSPCGHNTSQTLPSDPLPPPVRDSPPPPPYPDCSMPVPQSDSEAPVKRVKASGTKGRKFPGVVDTPQKCGSGKNKTGIQSGKNISSSRTSSSSRSTPAKSSPAMNSKSASAGQVSVYVDLAYVPSGASSHTVTVDFFKSIRSSCYIISGHSTEREDQMRQTLDALLEAKIAWPEKMQVTVIPTFESLLMQEWYQQTLDRQRDLSITVLGSNSTVAMQDETFPACKIEF